MYIYADRRIWEKREEMRVAENGVEINARTYENWVTGVLCLFVCSFRAFMCIVLAADFGTSTISHRHPSRVIHHFHRIYSIRASLCFGFSDILLCWKKLTFFCTRCCCCYFYVFFCFVVVVSIIHNPHNFFSNLIVFTHICANFSRLNLTFVLHIFFLFIYWNRSQVHEIFSLHSVMLCRILETTMRYSSSLK